MDLYKAMSKDVQVINKLGVCYLYLGKNAAAKQVFEKVCIFVFNFAHLQFNQKAISGIFINQLKNLFL